MVHAIRWTRAARPLQDLETIAPSSADPIFKLPAVLAGHSNQACHRAKTAPRLHLVHTRSFVAVDQLRRDAHDARAITVGNGGNKQAADVKRAGPEWAFLRRRKIDTAVPVKPSAHTVPNPLARFILTIPVRAG